MAVRVPTREELAAIFKEPRLILAVEALFKQSSAALTNDELDVALGNAASNAVLIKSLLEAANQKIDLMVMKPDRVIEEEEALNNSVLIWISVV